MRTGTLRTLGILTCAALGTGAGLAHAGPVGPMTNFTAGTTAKASEVNTNFTAVKSAVDDNDGRITTNAAGIATNAANIGTNASGIATNAANITDNNAALVAEINALKAQLAAAVPCPADTPTRFTDNGDSTICDSQTGLMWEKKLPADGSLGGSCNDASQGNRSIHCVNNTYAWTDGVSSTTAPTGTLFTEFLPRINNGQSVASDQNTIVRAGYTDWRVPNIVEFNSIVIARFPDPCPCIDPIFGPTQPVRNWASSTDSGDLTLAWSIIVTNGLSALSTKTSAFPVRAVRGGR